jgi:predicted lipoprotein with Yx(FWY)xxD motif
MRSRLLSIAPAAGLAVMIILAACQGPAGAGSNSASASESASASASASAIAAGVEVKVGKTSAGDALVGKDGRTLYFFTKDTTSGTSACTDSCAGNWPPLTLAAGEATKAGEGVTASWFATITRPDGSTQVTYNGHPLYYFANDKAAGEANGQGVGGIWFIATANGKLPSASASTKASPTASMGY